MKKIIFATSNQNKVKEINNLTPKEFEIQSLSDIGWTEEIPETSDTILGNAVLKATYLFERIEQPCFAEDTGLEVEALNGEPGVHSARYSGPERDAQNNMDKLLLNLKDHPNKKARFRTVIAYHDGQSIHTFEGIAAGYIIENKRGKDGFGYDPIFQPEGYEHTFAEMSVDEKSLISHRAKAFEQFLAFILTKDRAKE